MSKEKNLLERLWTMGEKAIEKSKMSKASKRLQRQAEIAVGASADLVDQAQDLFDASVREALETGDFDKIARASLNLNTEKKKHQSDLDTYELIFEESPKLV